MPGTCDVGVVVSGRRSVDCSRFLRLRICSITVGVATMNGAVDTVLSLPHVEEGHKHTEQS